MLPVSTPLERVAEALITLLNEEATTPQGLGALVQQFERNGLKHIVASWVDTCPSQAISPEQTKQGLGLGRVQQVARQLNLEPEDALEILASVLPNFVDQLTPHGAINDNTVQQIVKIMADKSAA